MAWADQKDAAQADAKTEAKGAKDWITKQEPLRVVPEIYLKSTPENTRLVVNLATPRIVIVEEEEQIHLGTLPPISR